MFELVFPTNNSFQWYHDSKPIAGEGVLDSVTISRLENIRTEFQSLFESGFRPICEIADIRHFFSQPLYEIFFKGMESDLPAKTSVGPHLWFIRSQTPEPLNLPWELVWLPDRDLPIGCDPRWGVVRVPGEMTECQPPSAGPLKVQFLAAAPEGVVPLDYEKEEDAMLQATARLSKQVIMLPFAETGGMEELTQLVNEHKPHVVHLSGHGIVKDGIGSFAFEDERGQHDLQPVQEIFTNVFCGSSVRCVVLNACQTGLAATSGLAGHLVSNGVPMVLGWGASVADDIATEFAQSFYSNLAGKDHVAITVAKARREIWNASQKKHKQIDLTFALSRLFALGKDGTLFDPTAPPQKYDGPKTEPMLLGEEIKGLREGFIGRRKEQQQLIPAFREGDFSVLVLTGIGGMGKSTLATRIANRLKEAGFEIYAIKATHRSNPAEAGKWFLLEKLLPALARPFLKIQPSIYESIQNGKYPIRDRIQLAVNEWKNQRLLLVIDNWEDVLNPDNTIADLDLRVAYETLTRNLTDGSRVLVTCRYIPAQTPTEATHVRVYDVKEFKLFELRKFLQRDATVLQRIQDRSITQPLIERLYQLFGGTPYFLVSVRSYLAVANLDDWEEEIPEDTPLEKDRQAYCERILLPKLYGLLPEEGKTLASRLAISELPLTIDALMQITDQPENKALQAADQVIRYGLIQRFTEEDRPTRYQVPGLIRSWLCAEDRLCHQDRQKVHSTLALFWKKCYEDDREHELQVRIDAGLSACRIHAQQAKQIEEFRWATFRLTRRLEAISEWKTARRLLEEIPESDRDGATWHQLATIDVNEGNYPQARRGFEKALQILQAIGDKAGEAATWHNLATIDLNEGNYPQARRAFHKSLEIEQAIGNKAGEAATWHQLGFLCWERDFKRKAIPLLMVSWILLQAIGAADLNNVDKNLNRMCSELDFTQEQFTQMLESTIQSYQQDRGASLLQEAFPEEG